MCAHAWTRACVHTYMFLVRALICPSGSFEHASESWETGEVINLLHPWPAYHMVQVMGMVLVTRLHLLLPLVLFHSFPKGSDTLFLKLSLPLCSTDSEFLKLESFFVFTV